MTSRATYSLTIALSCAMLAACTETVTEPEPVAGAASIPADASAAATLSFFQLSTGASHTCGVTTDQRLYCWGFNYNGQLGDGTSGNIRTRPVAAGGALRFLQVSAGSAHTCAVSTDRRVYCWGANGAGQLGDGSKSTQRETPAPVASGLRFRSVSVGNAHSCAVTYPDNLAYCWGYNRAGRLGNGTTSERLAPTPVSGGLRFRAVSAGTEHTCGVTPDNRAFCWGENLYGQIGDSTQVSERLTPTRVASGGRAFTQIDAGHWHTCAVTAAARAFCWGNGRNGELGNGKRYLSFWPRLVAGGLTFERVTAGHAYTCGEASGNRTYCWGYNETGVLGDGTTTTRLTPVAVKGNLFFSQVAAGGHSCGRTAEYKAYCWGGNQVGQLGNGSGGTGDRRLTPTAVVGP
jgi:alpha-tubulin suppressor-like RCC1 family protein